MSEPRYTAAWRFVQRNGKSICALAIAPDSANTQEEAEAAAAEIAAKLELHGKLVAALEGLIPVARACKFEDFSTLDGKESTKTEKLVAALTALEAARKAEACD